MSEVKLKSIIAPSFYDVHRFIKNDTYTHFWEKGGRGSTKSSFTSIEIVLGILKNPEANAIIFRKYATTLETSVYNQILWALDKLNVTSYFKVYKSPLRIEYKPTGQQILFCGLDDFQKIKSIKPKKGFFKYIWFEEVAEFDGMAEIRSVLQSVMRGGANYKVFYTYNPPADLNNWVNKEAKKAAPNKIVHHSTYLDVPRRWLGEQFFIEAELLKSHDETAYRHEYLGEEVGIGLNVFKNIEERTITPAEIAKFNNIVEGIDWGYAVDPFVWIKAHLDRKYKCLYIYDEIYQVGLSNDDGSELVAKKHNPSTEIIADSEEPKSIDDFDNAGLPIRGARKGPGSVSRGIKKLQGLFKIIIDPKRCPNAAREFSEYSLEPNKDGTIKSKYPDKNNHAIDAIRYSLEDEFDY